MVAIDDFDHLRDCSLGLLSGKYKSEEVVKFFRGVYGDNFNARDLNKVCRILGWKITRYGAKSDIVTVK